MQCGHDLSDNPRVVNSSRGRPSGVSDVRKRLFDAAVEVFLEVGYAQASSRMIAERAGVSHTLVNYHFGSKQELFGAVMSLKLTPNRVLGDVLTTGRDDPPAVLSRRLIGTILAVWDDARMREPFMAMLTNAVTDESVRLAVSEFMEREMFRQFVDHIGGPDASARAAGVVTVVAGLVSGRYLLRLGPLVDMSHEQIVRTLAPMVAVHLR